MSLAKKHQCLETRLEAYTEAVHDAILSFFKERLAAWPAYAAAAGSALALSTSAMADIIHNPGANSLTLNAVGNNFKSTKRMSLDGYGTVTAFLAFKFGPNSHRTTGNAAFGSATLRINSGQLIVNGTGGVKELAKGSPITSAHLGGGQHFLQLATFHSSINKSALLPQHYSSQKGSWQSATGYAGFRLPNGDPGWLKIEVPSNFAGAPGGVDILDWALATNGEKITAGQTCTPVSPIIPCNSGGFNGNGGGNNGGTGGGGSTGGGGTAVPEPGGLSLSLLAMGSVAVLAWRKMRKDRAAV